MTKRNSTNRAERVLEAAAKLIAHFGFDKTTISDIAREAGVAKGAIYLHWPGKDELLDALLVRETKRMLADLMARIEADPLGGTLPRMYLHALLVLRDNPMMRALYTQDGTVLGNAMQRYDRSRYSQRFLFGATFIEQMQAAGLVRAELDPKALAYLFSIISYGFTGIERIIPASHAPPLEQTAEVLVSLMQRGAALEGGSSAAGKQALGEIVAALNRQYAALETAAAPGPQAAE